MAIQNRLKELSNRHRKLDDQLDQERKRPAADSLRMSRLKREKLRLKEEIRELRAS